MLHNAQRGKGWYPILLRSVTRGEGGRVILLHCVTRRVGGVKFPQKERCVTFECSLNACVSAWGGEGMMM